LRNLLISHNTPFACRAGTGHWRYASAILKGEAGQTWLTIVVFLSAIRSHPGKKNYPFIAFQNVSQKRRNGGSLGSRIDEERSQLR